jgi:hypothetical protein
MDKKLVNVAEFRWSRVIVEGYMTDALACAARFKADREIWSNLRPRNELEALESMVVREIF